MGNTKSCVRKDDVKLSLSLRRRPRSPRKRKDSSRRHSGALPYPSQTPVSQSCPEFPTIPRLSESDSCSGAPLRRASSHPEASGSVSRISQSTTKVKTRGAFMLAVRQLSSEAFMDTPTEPSLKDTKFDHITHQGQERTPLISIGPFDPTAPIEIVKIPLDSSGSRQGSQVSEDCSVSGSSVHVGEKTEDEESLAKESMHDDAPNSIESNDNSSSSLL